MYLRSVVRAENGAGPADFWSCLARDAVLFWGFASYSFFRFSIVSVKKKIRSIKDYEFAINIFLFN